MIDPAIFIATMLSGFWGGVHCLGMCGGIVTACSIGIEDKKNVFWLNLAYNLGRISSYVIAGVIAGGVGFLLIKSSSGWVLQTALQVIAALLMIILGLYLSGIVKSLVLLEKAGNLLWRHIAPFAQKMFPFHSKGQAFLAGMLWGWLPCGLVYGVLMWSLASSSPVVGGLYMLGFGLGTLPNLLLLGLFAHRLKPLLVNKYIKLLAGISVIIYGLVMLYFIVIQ